MAFESTISPVLGLPRISKRLIALSVDVALCVITVWFSYFLRLGEWVAISGDRLLPAIASVALAVPIFVVSGLYRTLFRHAGISAFAATARAVGIYGVLYAAWFTAVSMPGVPRTVGIIQPVLLLLAVGCSRAFAGYWLGGAYRTLLAKRNRDKVMIYGAGSSGRQLAGAVANSLEMRVVGFIDDDPTLHGSTLNGLTIHDPNHLESLVARLEVDDILLAIPSASRMRRNQIIERLRNAQVGVRTLPGLMDLAQGKVHASDVRELDIEDLLGRDAVPPAPGRMSKNIRDKVVLVTGAGGSIGSEICRQIMTEHPAHLLLVESSELALYEIHQELTKRRLDGAPSAPVILTPLLVSVNNVDRINDIMDTWRPQTVYHAAAYKHVPLVEHNPLEGIRNNVTGTITVARSAIEYGVNDFVLISTDKAVRPTNIMGASKRLAEMALQALAHAHSGTRFSMVRFGNVLGSSGSVVPLFRQQIRDGGPVTITHPDITRYFMTIPEAAQLVIQAGAMASGGEVFVLDMGDPVRIADLARRMVELSGLTIRDDERPDGDIAIEMVGLRPGEKLFEELLIGNDPRPTDHPRIMKASEKFIPWRDLLPLLERLEADLRAGDPAAARRQLQELVPDYRPTSDIVDWVYLEQARGALRDHAPDAVSSAERAG